MSIIFVTILLACVQQSHGQTNDVEDAQDGSAIRLLDHAHRVRPLWSEALDQTTLAKRPQGMSIDIGRTQLRLSSSVRPLVPMLRPHGKDCDRIHSAVVPCHPHHASVWAAAKRQEEEELSPAITATLMPTIRAATPANIWDATSTTSGNTNLKLDHLAQAFRNYSSELIDSSRELVAEGLGRRAILLHAAASTAGILSTATMPSAARASLTTDAEKVFWTQLPFTPGRKTVRREVGPGVWSFEQLIGLLTIYVYSPIRMTVVAMKAGGLFVYAPVAPTSECLALLQPLIDQYGPIKYIVLPTAAPEHVGFAGSFARAFPSAEFYTTATTFPPDLPPGFFSFPRSPKPLPSSSQGLGMWDDEFEHEVLANKASSSYTYQEAAFFHKPSKTLLLCDTLMAVPAGPPPIMTSTREYIRALLFWARDDLNELLVDSPEVLRRGWQRMTLLPIFLLPGSVILQAEDVLKIATAKRPMPELGWAGVLPSSWRQQWEKSFEPLYNNGEPTVAPIVQLFLLLDPNATQRWVNAITQWNFEVVVPVHFDAPISIGPGRFAESFEFLRRSRDEARFCDEDLAFLRVAFDFLLGSLRGRSCGFA